MRTHPASPTPGGARPSRREALREPLIETLLLAFAVTAIVAQGPAALNALFLWLIFH